MKASEIKALFTSIINNGRIPVISSVAQSRAKRVFETPMRVWEAISVNWR